MASETQTQTAGQNHDRLPDPLAVPSSDVGMDISPPATGGNRRRRDADNERPDDASEGSEEHSDSEDEDEQEKPFQWEDLPEDKTEPCEDEMIFIKTKEEHSALDYKYWQRKTFFDLDDPELVPGESGRIDWLVENFNGTKDNPNKEHIMRSSIVRIGGYDWRMKLYPRGNDTDFISMYLECVSMQSPDFKGTEDFKRLPLPFLEGSDKGVKRSAVSIQLSVVMYNPAEPRVYEYNRDAHQFTKGRADYGWTRFTRQARRDFVYRHHGQRQAIYRNDKLAFAAHIRIINDPTGCLWAHGHEPFGDSVSLTGLRPFSPQLPMYAAELPLLHFAPFRKLIQQRKDTRTVFWLQTMLWKMMSRKHSQQYGSRVDCVQSDTISSLRFLARCLRKEIGTWEVNELLGRLDPDDGAAVASNRLKTKNFDSVQAALDAHPNELEKPVLLTLELERQEFDKEERRWNKLTNKVKMNDVITVAGTSYTLYAFATHCGDLESNKFNSYIRPNGPTGQWYKYGEGSVMCLTHKDAVSKNCGWDKPSTPEKVRSHRHHRSEHSLRTPYRGFDLSEVAHAVMYVRDDHAASLTASPEFEAWDVPQNVKDGAPPKLEEDGKEDAPAPATDAPVLSAEEAAAVVAASDLPELIPPPPLPEVDGRRGSFDSDAGYATPNCWLMDGEDVVMSDIDDDETPTPDNHTEVKTKDSATNNNPTVTIDVLGREYYRGQMSSSLYHGNGQLITMSGDQYTGTFTSGQKSGSGTLTYAASGNTYTGDWLSDLPHGQGTYTEFSSGNVFEGGWKDGRKHGAFVLRGTVTEEDKGRCSICFEGDLSTAFYDCGHVVACKECAGRIEVCPVCRRRVLARLELFGVRMVLE